MGYPFQDYEKHRRRIRVSDPLIGHQTKLVEELVEAFDGDIEAIMNHLNRCVGSDYLFDIVSKVTCNHWALREKKHTYPSVENRCVYTDHYGPDKTLNYYVSTYENGTTDQFIIEEDDHGNLRLFSCMGEWLEAADPVALPKKADPDTMSLKELMDLRDSV